MECLTPTTFLWSDMECYHVYHVLVFRYGVLRRVTHACVQVWSVITYNTCLCSGMERCHVRDGAAVCSFLAWLEKEAPKRTQTEMSAAAHLELCRA